MLRNMLDGDGQDQYDSGGWCFPKPIPPVQRNGEWVVSAMAALLIHEVDNLTLQDHLVSQPACVSHVPSISFTLLR